MALVLIKEDGTGKVDANSYANAADGDAYFDGHLYASAWAAATAENKDKALVFATRLIDAQFQFNGGRARAEQALQWPRLECPDPDGAGDGESAVAADAVPAAVVRATCEMARELLISDRTTAPPGEGIGTVQTSTATHDGTGAGSSSMSSTTYSKADTRPVVSRVAQAMLSKYGAPISGGSGPVRLLRV